MMKLLRFMICLGVGLGLGLMVYRDPGYVLFAWNVWTVELPLWVFFVLITATLVLLVWLNSSVQTSERILKRWALAIKSAKSNRAEHLLSEGLTLLARAEFSLAERKLVRSAKLSTHPLLAFLGAAKAARAQQAEDRALAYMAEAQARVGQDEFALNLEKAKIEVESDHVNQALDTLAECERLAPKHPALTGLILQVALKTHDLERLRTVLEHAASSEATPDDVNALEKSAVDVLLAHFKTTHAYEEAAIFFARLPRRLQNEEEVLCGYVDILIAANEHDRAKKIIESQLKRTWSGMLVKRYAFVRTKKPSAQLKQAEAWLALHPEDPDLLLTLGRLCQQQQFLEQARTLLLKSVKIKPQPEAYFELGQIARATHEMAASVQYFEEGLKLSSRVTAV